MGNTYTQIHIKSVFAVQNRICLIKKSWKNDLHKYITGIVQKNGHKLLAIDGMPDHIHVFFGMRPSQSLSDLMQDIKGSSSTWINREGFTNGKFTWQEGYGAFSYCKAHVKSVIEYVRRQEEHHRRTTFDEEYRNLLIEFDMPYDERYVLRGVDYDDID